MSKINLHNYEAFLIDYLDGSLNETSIIELRAFILANPQLEIDLDDLDLPAFTTEDIKIDFKNELKKPELFLEDEQLINYLENNLPEEERKVIEFNLLTNRDLALKLEAYKKTILRFDNTTGVNKTGLYKTEDDLVLNNKVLAYVEGQLNTSDKLHFEKELATNASLQKELASFQKTKLTADDTIVFKNKETLKKEAKVIALFSLRTVTSMAAAILLLFGFAFMFNYYNTKPTFAKTLAKITFIKPAKNINYQSVNKVNSSNELNTIEPQSTDLIAKKTNEPGQYKTNNSIGHDDLNEAVSNSVAVVKEKKTSDPLVNNAPEDTVKENVANNKSVIDTSNTSLAVTNLNASEYSKQNYLITVEEEDDEVAVTTPPVKKGFWQRAVKVAQQVNKLGVKAIDGEETQGKNYALSFNSFSVEKR